MVRIGGLSNRADRLLQEARVARLATADASGRPHLVPVVFARCKDRLYIPVDHKPKRSTDPNALRRIINLRENPRASLLVDRYEETWRNLAWCRADGRVELLTDGPLYIEGVDALSRKYPQYRDHPLPSPGEGLLILIHIETIRAWRA